MALTVKEVRERLADLPDHLPVVLAKDPEGNHFSAANSIDVGNVEPTHSWQWAFLSASSLEEDADLAALEINAVCLWPVN